MKTTLLHYYANVVQWLTVTAKQLVRPVYFASTTETIIVASVGVALFIVGMVISRTARRSPDFERMWTERRLQFTGVFGTVALLLAFLRYEGIPYVSMPVVFGLICLWAAGSFAQLALYRQFKLKSARAQWSDHKAREQYLPKPKRVAR